MLRIAHVVRRFVFEEWGGTETVVWNTALNQQMMGHCPEILCTSALTQPGTERRDGILIRRFPYIYPYFPMPDPDRLALDKKGGNPWCKKLIECLKKGKYDIIHIHCGGRLAATAAKIAKQRGIPSVITLHGGAVAVPEAEMNEMLRPVRHKFHYGRIFDWLSNVNSDPVAAADKIITISREEEKRVRELYPHKQVYYLPNGINPFHFREPVDEDIRKEYNIPAERKIILCISRIDYQKNQRILLRLLEQTSNTHLLLIGPVTAKWYYDEIIKEAKMTGVFERLTVVPGLPSNSPMLVSALHAGEAFVLPSLHEPFGIVALEAWAAGIPLIASNAGGLKDFITDGVNGLLFSPKDPDAMVACWNHLENILGEREKLIENAARMVDEYDWQRVIAKLMEIYAATP
jgi:glycosyltransferase involved in cell wall biosynthesis